MVNTERFTSSSMFFDYYNILNIVVNTELDGDFLGDYNYYNILNIVVNTEQKDMNIL